MLSTSKKSSLAPVILFVYNRHRHTQQTLESLTANHMSKDSKLFIYCDGPKNGADEIKVKEVRKLVRSRKWCRSVEIIEREANWGLAQSIISGLTDITSKYGRAIVLEDDLILSPFFLRFMNNALAFYENEPKVMHISGYMFPVKGELPETFFYRATSCWGWATWERAWKHFEADVTKLMAELKKQNRKWEFDIGDSMNYYKMLQDQATGTIDSWAIRWYASVFLKEGFCLHPGRSLVQNIGHDGSGVHCGETDIYNVTIDNNAITHFTEQIEECSEAFHLMTKFYRTPSKSLLARISDKIRNLIKT